MIIERREQFSEPVGRGGAGADKIPGPVLVSFAFYLALAGVAWWVVERLLPDRLVLNLLGHALALKELHRRLGGILLVMAGMIPGIFAAEILLGGWRNSSLRYLLVERTGSGMSDLVCFLCGQGRVMTLAAIAFTFGASLISGEWLHDWLSAATGLSLSLASAPAPLQIMIYLLIYTFFDYWNHRVSHTRWFWPLHRYHHSAEEFSVMTAVRTHPATFTDVVSTTLPAAALKLSPELILSVNLFIVALRYLIHSRIDSNFGWVGRYLIQSPTHHRLHHILDTTLPTANFALTPLWDRVFGTWRDEGDQSVVIGVDTPYRHGAWVLSDMWRDYCDFWKALVLRETSG